MNLNHLLLWMVGASSCLSAVLLIVAKQWRTGRFLISLLIPILLAGLCVITPETAGYWIGGIWGALVLLPLVLGNTVINRCLATERFVMARRTAQVLAWLHPFDGNWSKPAFVEALRLAHWGNSSQALQLIDRLKLKPNTIGRAAAVMGMRLTGNWQEFIEWVNNDPQQHGKKYDGQVLDAYIQALGESGQREEMFQVFETWVVSHRVPMSAALRSVIRMKVAAFSGQLDLAQRLLAGPLANIPPENRMYWTATALQSSGQLADATALLLQIQQCGYAAIVKAAQRRLNEPVPSLSEQPLSEFESGILRHLMDAVSHESQYGVLTLKPPRPQFGTWGLITVLGIVFSLEIPGGSEDPYNLVDLGAMLMPAAHLNGQWWRVITAGMLHFGPLHLLLNCLALLIFAPRVERVWGSLFMLLCFALTSVGAVFLTVSLYPLDGEPTILVGASGGVMGLIGVILGQLGVGVLRRSNFAVKSEFMMLLSVIGLQMVFDSMTPAVSSTCHLMGLLLGLVLGALAVSMRPQRTLALAAVESS